MLFELFLSRNAKMYDEYLAKPFEGPYDHPDLEKYLYGPLAKYTANGGKRHRPLVCGLACEAVGGSRKECISAAAAVEHFHNAALIHDDIADEATLRRGEPAMHITLGEGLAINSGDLALSLVTGTVVDDDTLNDSVKIRLLKELIAMTTRTIEGQALDLGWVRDKRFDIKVDDYLCMAMHKTAYYSCAVPLVLGAIVGGGTDEQIEALRSFGHTTGLAFQIQDDLLNLIGTKEATQKDFRSDITEGKRTLMVVHALENSTERDELVEILSSHTTDVAKLDRAVEIMQASGSIDFAKQYAEDITVEAKKEIEGKLPKSKAYDLLLSMADFFVERLK